jgi:hypothetical protein
VKERWGALSARAPMLEVLSLGAAGVGVLSLPAALVESDKGLGPLTVVAVGGLACGGLAWALVRSQRATLAGYVLVGGLSVVLGVAVLLAVDQPGVWAGLVCSLGRLALRAAWLGGGLRVLAWGVGEVGLWVLTVALRQGRPDWQTANLTLVFLLAANGVAWLLAGGRLAGQAKPEEILQSTTASLPAPDGARSVLVNQIESAAHDLDLAANTIHGVAAEQMAGADRQEDTLSDISATLEEYQQVLDKIGTLAEVMMRVSQEAAARSSEGQEVASGAIASLEHIRSQVRSIAVELATLAQHTERIGEIIAPLGDLATQSNFLALNASIEAARAGQHGRGFAVVAAEVRDLAQQSAEAAAQVRRVLAEIRQAVQQTATATDASATGVESGVSKVAASAQVVGRIASSIAEATAMAQEIVAFLQERSGAVDGMATSIESIDQVQMQHRANARMAGAVAENLGRLSEQVREALSHLDEGEVVK